MKVHQTQVSRVFLQLSLNVSSNPLNYQTISPWDMYLSPQLNAEVLADYRHKGQVAFKNQREQIQRIFDIRQPNIVACLGAGFLNDIPYKGFVEAGAEVHLVDWMVGVTEFGLAHSILSEDKTGSPNCVYCQMSNAEMFCNNFEGKPAPDLGVCDGYKKSGTGETVCEAFQKGALPYLHQQDVTGGFAAKFGSGLGSTLEGVLTWRQAFKRAIAFAENIKTPEKTLDIKGNSVDLVLSSMVISQFEHEPYDYFARAVASLLGVPDTNDEARLKRPMEKLRSILFERQLKGHLAEIERMMATDGRCFMAFEFLHNDPDKDRWFLIDQMHKAVGMMSEHFDFDIDAAPQIITEELFENASGKSLVYHLLLSHRSA